MTKNIFVELLDNDGNIISKTEYASLMELKNKFPAVKYHQLREIYLYNTGKLKRNLQPSNKHLLQHMRITDKEIDLFSLLNN